MVVTLVVVAFTTATESGTGSDIRALIVMCATHVLFTDLLAMGPFAGASHGLDLACRHLGRPGDLIFVERPTYFLVQPIFEQCGLTAVGVATDHEGIRVDALEKMLLSDPRLRCVASVRKAETQLLASVRNVVAITAAAFLA